MDQETFDKLTQQSSDTITAKVICDSINPDGVRLTTFEWTYPRMIHSEIMTHRKLSRNSASSRAIPLNKMIQRVVENPVFPIYWGKNQKGMQATEELDQEQKIKAAICWMTARASAVVATKALEELGVHKQIGNRLLEPWMWITVIVSATNFENLFALRCHPAAEPHFQNLAYKVRDALDESAGYTCYVGWGHWHLPFISDEERGTIPKEDQPKVSAGRCARVSYLTHDGKRDPAEDIRLYNQLAGSFPLHASPLEHPAQAVEPKSSKLFKVNPVEGSSSGLMRKEFFGIDWGNFDPGFLQFRKMHENENITKRRLSDQPLVDPGKPCI